MNATVRAWMRAAIVCTLAWLPPGAQAQDDAQAAAVEPELEAAVAHGAATPAVDARVTRGADGLEVEGRFRVVASHAVAWAVLTDYDAIHTFVSSMNQSRVTSRNGGDVLVDQVATGSLLFVKHRVHTTLWVHEEPPGIIRFEDVLLKDFKSYRGEWRIEDHGREVEVVYHVQARPTSSVPDFVARGMFQKTVRQLLSQIEKEIANRAAMAERFPTERSRP